MMEYDPSYVVSWDVFQRNAFPYMEVRRPFILGTANQKWKATVAHRFAELLHTKTNKVTRIYTQNIDGLYSQCKDIPSGKLVHVHGTISEAACEGCGQDMKFGEFCDKVEANIKDIYSDKGRKKDSKPINCPSCGRPLVKPKTVLFGRSLPEEFFEKTHEDLPKVDLLIVAGTSLLVSPANTVVYRVPKSTIRVVINQEPVGQDLGIEYSAQPKRDFFAQGDCDKVFLQLIRELGWLSDLERKKDLLPEKSRELL